MWYSVHEVIFDPQFRGLCTGHSPLTSVEVPGLYNNIDRGSFIGHCEKTTDSRR